MNLRAYGCHICKDTLECASAIMLWEAKKKKNEIQKKRVVGGTEK